MERRVLSPRALLCNEQFKLAAESTTGAKHGLISESDEKILISECLETGNSVQVYDKRSMDTTENVPWKTAQQSGKRFTQKVNGSTNVKLGVITSSTKPVDFDRLEPMGSVPAGDGNYFWGLSSVRGWRR